MAPVTYYYFISIITAGAPLLWLINLIYLRTKGRTTFGQAYTVGTPEYKHMLKVASNRNIAITTLLSVLLIINLIWSVLTVLNVNTPSSQQLLVAAPIIVLIAWFFMLKKFRKDYQISESSKGKRKKTSGNRAKDGDSWLS